MSVLVNDTNIFIDMYAIGMLDKMCDLPFEIHTVDFVMDEMTNPEQLSALDTLIKKKRLRVYRFSAEEINAIALEYRNVSGNLSLTDCSVCYYAREKSLTLITGDKQLRNYAQRCSVKVYGLLFLFDQMVTHRVISPHTAAEKLKELMSVNARLPQPEILKRIEAWDV